MASTLYHSTLVRDTNQHGRISLTIESDPHNPFPSKFQGKPPYIRVKYQGQDCTLGQEHTNYFDPLFLRKGETVTLKASGSGKDGSAKLEVLSGGAVASAEGADATSVRPTAIVATDTVVAAKAPSAPPAQPSVTSTSTNGSIGSLDAIATSFYAALGKADSIVAQFWSEEQRGAMSAYEVADLTLRLANSLSITLQRQ